MPRKTIDVELTLERANFYLKNSPDREQRERVAIANFLESILGSAYAGFTYLESAGMVRGEDGYAIDFGDESRRHYNLHVSIR